MTPEEAVAAVDFGKASAAKRGRNPRYPFVPIVKKTDRETGAETTEQIRARAFATREEAVDYAAKTIAVRRDHLLARLRLPNFRALRAMHGVD